MSEGITGRHARVLENSYSNEWVQLTEDTELVGNEQMKFAENPIYVDGGRPVYYYFIYKWEVVYNSIQVFGNPLYLKIKCRWLYISTYSSRFRGYLRYGPLYFTKGWNIVSVLAQKLWQSMNSVQ